VIIGQQQPETTPVFTAAAQSAGSPLYFAEEQFYVNDFRQHPNQLELSVVRKDTGEHLSYALDLQGIYQTRNILPVLTAVHLLQAAGWNIPEAAVHAGLAATRKLTGLHGRWEKVHRHPDLILDVAHNQAGMAQVLEQLELTDYRHLHLVTGMVKDKDVAAVLAMLPKTATFYFTRAQIERAMPEAELAVLAADAGLAGHTFPDVNTAIDHALQHAHENDLILICGSVFLVGEVNLLAI
jgi:dihydrofolate synthase/folylpolyglutamate synthase